jgi:Cu/Ag efflux pump CusA
MMWIVRLALRRPYTFIVAAFLILILGVFSILTMPTDIFPNLAIYLTPPDTIGCGFTNFANGTGSI